MRYEEFVGNVAERGASEVQVIEGRTALGLFRLYLGGNSNAHVDSEAWDQVVALPCRRA
ncbi:MAG: hypothetical protein QOG57_80 [Pseudonocardiales bacterium]|nr:hypothetical protein [Pseudonocardiales bacterium]